MASLTLQGALYTDGFGEGVVARNVPFEPSEFPSPDSCQKLWQLVTDSDKIIIVHLHIKLHAEQRGGKMVPTCAVFTRKPVDSLLSSFNPFTGVHACTLYAGFGEYNAKIENL